MNKSKFRHFYCSEKFKRNLFIFTCFVLAIIAHFKADEWTAVFTFTLSIFTAFLYYATMQLVKGAENTTIRQLRAYVGLKIGEWNPHSFSVRLSLFAYGNTPAKKVRTFANIDILPYPLSKTEIIPLATEHIAQSLTLFPNKPTDGGWIKPDKKFSAKDIQEINSAVGNKRWYVYGYIKYEDIFNKERQTSFRFFLDPSSIQTNADGTIRAIWAQDKEGNDIE